MTIAVNQLAIEKNHVLIGVSLGTNISSEMLKHGLNPKGIAVIGSCVFGAKSPWKKYLSKK